jgi:hypothetical protein
MLTVYKDDQPSYVLYLKAGYRPHIITGTNLEKRRDTNLKKRCLKDK